MKNTSGKKNIKTFLLNFSKGETISNLKIKKKKKKKDDDSFELHQNK